MARGQRHVDGLAGDDAAHETVLDARRPRREAVRHHHVHVAGPHRELRLGDVEVVDLQVDLRAAEALEETGQQRLSGAGQRADADRAGGGADELVEPSMDPGEHLADLVRAGREQAALGRQPEAPAVGLDEAHPDLPLRGAQLLGDRGGRAVGGRGDGGQGPAVGQVTEELEVTQIHEANLMLCVMDRRLP